MSSTAAPTPEPDPAETAAVEPDADADADADVTPDGAPLNRADRRAKSKGGEPSHVGPRAARTPAGRGARSHTKRQTS